MCAAILGAVGASRSADSVELRISASPVSGALGAVGGVTLLTSLVGEDKGAQLALGLTSVRTDSPPGRRSAAPPRGPRRAEWRQQRRSHPWAPGALRCNGSAL